MAHQLKAMASNQGSKVRGYSQGTFRRCGSIKAEDLDSAHLSSKALVKLVLVSSGNWVPLRGFPLDKEGGNYI